MNSKKSRQLAVFLRVLYCEFFPRLQSTTKEKTETFDDSALLYLALYNSTDEANRGMTAEKKRRENRTEHFHW